MEAIQRIWNFFQFFSMLILPQLLGVLAYFRIRRFHSRTLSSLKGLGEVACPLPINRVKPLSFALRRG